MTPRVAWVTGASRGVGRAIAVALGRAGWTVWVTARSGERSGPTSHLPGTVEEVARSVTEAGGRGIAMFGSGVRTHYVTSAFCAPLLIRSAPSAIVTVSMEAGARHDPAHGVAYSVAKAADDRLAEAMAGQLCDGGVASVAIYPGLVRTEGVLQFARGPVHRHRRALATAQ